MKKIFTVSVVGLCLASLVGCSSSNTNANAASSTSSSQTAQQASQQTSPSSSNGGQGDHKGGPFNNQELLSLLKTDSNTLQSELKAGKSLADVAQEKGVQEQQVIDLLVKEQDQRTADAVKSGKLTQDKADQMKSKEQDRIKQEVERKGGFGGNGQGQHRQKNGDQQSNSSNSSSNNG